MLKINKQIKGLYLSSVLANLSLTGAWVALLAARGYSLMEIGIAETVFHITSLAFELPSGVFADVFGRKKMLIAGSMMQIIGNVIMIVSRNLLMVCASIAFQALSYNFVSGSKDALAYDSLKLAGEERHFEKYASNQMILYRLCSGVSTLCAGLALFIGHRLAYSVDVVLAVIQIRVLTSLCEAGGQTDECGKGSVSVWRRLADCFGGSIVFLKDARRAIGLMFCNSFVGAADTLLLFFLQAKLPMASIPNWALGMALLSMELGGVLGSGLILKCGKLRYRQVFFFMALLVFAGVCLEHSGSYLVMTAGGFLAALGDDALQVRTNAVLQDMFPSEQRATLISVESFTFSVIMVVLSPLAGALFSWW